MAIEVKAPHEYKTVFLAGSIEMGKAEPWQKELANALDDLNVVIFNPKRDDWDNDFPTSSIKAQIRWELDKLEKADFIVMYFDPKTKSPISLLELGLYAQSGKLIVCCPEGFWRKDNVDMVCERYEVDLYTDKKTFFEKVHSEIRRSMTVIWL